MQNSRYYGTLTGMDKSYREPIPYDKPSPADIAEKQAYADMTKCGGLSGDTSMYHHQTQARMPSLRERVESARYRADKAARNKENMMELGRLLDKNPDVARILDLVKQLED